MSFDHYFDSEDDDDRDSAPASTVVTILLGGRAADVELGAGPNAGAELDLETATSLLLTAAEAGPRWRTIALADDRAARSRIASST